MYRLINILFLSFLSVTNVISPPPPGPKVSGEGGICGGFMLAGQEHSCEPHLECVNTRGPMIADAPGTCHVKCATFRDSWGNCVPKNCEIWDDGCQTCHIDEKHLLCDNKNLCLNPDHKPKCDSYSTKGDTDTFVKCNDWMNQISEMNRVCCANEKDGQCVGSFPKKCSPECASIVNILFDDCQGVLDSMGLSNNPGYIEFKSKCKVLDKNSLTDKKIPADCAIWFDGCNTCHIQKGGVQMCTKMACLQQQEAKCKTFYTPDDLANGKDIKHERGRQCFDGIDNDKDGKKDCQDTDCLIYGRCRHVGGTETGRECFDGKDNDNDKLTYCQDPDCMKDPRSRRHCQYQNSETGRECFDGKDNDKDGKTDCQDPDCLKDRRSSWRCNHETGKECFDKKDNDNDGKTDCQDPDCLRDPRIRQNCGGGRGNQH